MQQFSCTLADPEGLHARPAGKLVSLACSYASVIELHKAEKAANCRRLFALLSLCVRSGEPITFTVEGEDEEAAIAALRAFVLTLS